MSDDNNYNYEIERTFAKYGGEADKCVERTCGNCYNYDPEIWRCRHYENAEDGAIYDETEEGCWYHMTHAEQGRLAALVKKHQDEVNRQRLEEQRRNGTGECEGCPFREIRDMMQKVVNLDVLAGYWDVKNNCSLRESIEKLLKKARGEE